MRDKNAPILISFAKLYHTLTFRETGTTGKKIKKRFGNYVGFDAESASQRRTTVEERSRSLSKGNK